MNKRTEGIYKYMNEVYEKLNQEQFIVLESWRKTKKRLQDQYLTAIIKYSYKTKQFRIIYKPPSNLVSIKKISISN